MWQKLTEKNIATHTQKLQKDAQAAGSAAAQAAEAAAAQVAEAAAAATQAAKAATAQAAEAAAAATQAAGSAAGSAAAATQAAAQAAEAAAAALKAAKRKAQRESCDRLSNPKPWSGVRQGGISQRPGLAYSPEQLLEFINHAHKSREAAQSAEREAQQGTALRTTPGA